MDLVTIINGEPYQKYILCLKILTSERATYTQLISINKLILEKLSFSYLKGLATIALNKRIHFAIEHNLRARADR
jgi:hypothetical protein